MQATIFYLGWTRSKGGIFQIVARMERFFIRKENAGYPFSPLMPNKSGLPQSAVAGYIVNPENLRPLLCRLLAKEPRRRIRVAIGLRILRQ